MQNSPCPLDAATAATGLLLLCFQASGCGSVALILAAFDNDGFFCAIDASGKQDVRCYLEFGQPSQAQGEGKSWS
ncbi:unnamed protein product [Linum trigynum]